jgi:hypothetical protein
LTALVTPPTPTPRRALRYRVAQPSAQGPAVKRERVPEHDPVTTAWPTSLRVKDVEGAPGLWEMTWSLAGPDGRAKFEWIEIDGEPAIRWRCIGGHAILGAP